MNIFFDLDGTLVDSSDRHYKVYSEIVLSYGGKPMPKEDYWMMIQSKSEKSLILERSGLKDIKAEEYLEKFIENIEKAENLSCEKLINQQIFETLENLKRKYRLYLITLRKASKEASNQVKKMRLDSYFDKVIVTESKKEAIKPYLDSKSVLVGDTELDVQTAKDLGMISIAVYSGFRSKQFLEAYKPDYLIENVNDIESILNENSIS